LKQVSRRVVGEFSKGMQRRIGLAQALINDPDLVILDEPTAGLDPIGCREVKDLILALAARGKTVILSSHLLADVQDVCDRVVIYYGGRIQAMGSLEELLATPDAMRITVPLLSRETTQRLLEVIRADVAEDKVRIDTPTQNLESYFLGVVQKARTDLAETSGALSGSKVADYLRGPAEPVSAAARVLARLSQPVPQRASAPEVTDEKASPIRTEKLEELARPVKDNAPPPPAPAPPVDLSKANEKLSSLLSKPK
jgi:ABC-2 type transport system ATP-binding protein